METDKALWSQILSGRKVALDNGVGIYFPDRIEMCGREYCISGAHLVPPPNPMLSEAEESCWDGLPDGSVDRGSSRFIWRFSYWC